MDEENEILDVFDLSEQRIGTIRRGDIKQLNEVKGHYIRAVNAFIQNDYGEIWIPKRSPLKTFAPNGLDYSVGGHLLTGEDYIDGLIREFQEEVRLSIKPGDLTPISSSTPKVVDQLCSHNRFDVDLFR